MPVLFVDSFGHYTGPATKWGLAFNSQINLPSATARTNTGLLQVFGGVSGPQRILRNLGTQFTNVIVQVAVFADTPGVTQNPTALQMQVNPFGYNIGVRVNGDGTVSVWRGGGDTAEVSLATSTARPFVWNCWNSIECKVLIAAANGTVELRVNGQVVISLSGIRTAALAAFPYTDLVQLFGTGAGLWFMADFVAIDWSSAPNNTYINQAKVYVVTPFGNGAPLAWTPLAGTNFSQVNEIPPDGDTSYNSSGNIGDVDQYQVQATGVPGAAVIQALQHNMDLKVDSGARTVASVVGGTVGLANALTTTYTIYPAPQDSVPAFPVGVGPKVTA